MIKVPLDYVIIDDPMVLSDPLGGHVTWEQELIASAPILTAGSASFTQTYLDDRSMDGHIIIDLECWSYVSPAKNTREWTSALLILKIH